MTPFDREDIYRLATEIDDVVDFLEEAAGPARALRSRDADASCRRAVRRHRPRVRKLSFACDNLKGMRGVQDALVELKNLEDEGDRILRDALGSLFRGEAIDPLIVIRWKDIYEALERALDACETAANVIANIAVKNA